MRVNLYGESGIPNFVLYQETYEPMNAVKTFFLLMVWTGLLLLVDAMFGGEIGIVLALVLSLIMNVGAYLFSYRIAGHDPRAPGHRTRRPGALQACLGAGVAGRTAHAKGIFN